jgi:serine/threonine protein phosphatase 1
MVQLKSGYIYVVTFFIMRLDIIKSPKGRRLVISDIHGCSKTLRVIIENRICLTPKDHLFFLGDYIDRGPDSSGVLDYVISLINQGYNIYPLRGNHEENLLNAIKEYDRETLAHFVCKINKSPDLLNENKSVKREYVDFMSKLEYYYELDDFIIVHAGINFNVENPFQDFVSMLELRKTNPNPIILNGRRILHGHQVTPLFEIEKAVAERQPVIPLDNGCFYTKPHKIYDHNQTGNLCCLNLDTFELIVQKNIEIITPI